MKHGKLLLHIAYYMNPDKRLDNKHGIDKSSNEFTEHVLQGVMTFLEEIDNYEGFDQKDVVLDINEENVDVQRIDQLKYPNINLSFNIYNFHDEHPFRLTTKHRISIQSKMNDYDWFGYSEDDTIISKESIDYLVNNSINLFEKENKVYTIPRLVHDQSNNYFFSDIRNSSSVIKTVNGKAVNPENRFGACWFYPKKVMEEWIKNKSFLNFNYKNVNGGIRVMMGWGISEIDAIVPINSDNEPALKCIHNGYSGKYYFPHPGGFHKLPINKLCR